MKRFSLHIATGLAVTAFLALGPVSIAEARTDGGQATAVHVPLGTVLATAAPEATPASSHHGDKNRDSDSDKNRGDSDRDKSDRDYDSDRDKKHDRDYDSDRDKKRDRDSDSDRDKKRDRDYDSDRGRRGHDRDADKDHDNGCGDGLIPGLLCVLFGS